MIRKPIIRASFEGELVVDNFAGGGGASTGICEAIGRPVDIAINHSPEAIAMHKANHPETRHFCENILEIDPRAACGGRPVGLAWFSPDCTHFSRAKGGVPVKKEIRGLANVVIKWARSVSPRVIMLENVEEFKTWGPLRRDNKPNKRRAGESFRKWVSALTTLGYSVDFRSIVAADHGTPTTRRRLFMVARRDGRAAVWPQPTHGEGLPHDWRTASEIIDWSIPCPSIFGRKRPLAEKTLRRIAVGVKRFVIDADSPFIVPSTSRELTSLVAPTLIKYHGGVDSKAIRPSRLDIPIATVDTSNRFAIVAAFLSRYFGQSVGQGLDRPAPTVTAGGQGKTALVAALISKHYTGVVGHGVRRPLGTITSWDHHSLTCAFMTKFYGTSTGSPLSAPLPTVTSGGGRGGGHLGLVTIRGESYQIVNIGMRMLQPAELFRAQGFPDDYEIRPLHKGRPLTKTAQVSLAGNAVCPQVAEALVAQNAAS